jgi:WD40-like Beta Propeller Repeat
MAVAVGLLVAAASPVSGAPGNPGAADAPLTADAPHGVTGTGRLRVDVPIRPAPPAEPASFAPPPGTTTLVSVDQGGGFPSGVSAQPSISANGRYVAFASFASNLVPNDTNEAIDVFVRDRRQPGSTIRLPLPNGGRVPAGGSATEPSIAADGSVVAFVYRPPQSPVGTVEVPSQPVVMAWVRAKNATEIVSFQPTGELARNSTEPSVSGNGTLVAFTTVGPPDASGTPGVSIVLVRDRGAAATTLVSARADGAPGSAGSRAPAISRDGRIVAFESDANDLVAGDGNATTDVFVRDLAAKRTELISTGVGGAANGASRAPAISADGRRIAFESQAKNLIAGAAPAHRNVYVRDRTDGATFLASSGLSGADAAADSGQAAITDDGRIVAFASAANNLTASAVNADLAAAAPAVSEVYAHDVLSGETIRISEARGGGPAGGQNVGPTMGGNGRFVAFASSSPALVGGDSNNVGDVFLRDLPAVPVLNPPSLEFGVRAITTAGAPIAAILTNSGWGPLTGKGSARTGGAADDFAVVFDGCLGVSLHRFESCPITVAFTPTVKGTRIAQLAVAHDGPKSPSTARLRGGGSRAVLTLSPPVGAPGIVVIATGSDFPPNTEIGLTWSRGLTPKLPVVKTDAKGGFRVQVLIFHHDLVGPRDLVATPRAGTGFPPFGAVFLVVESPSQPPRFIVQGPYADRPPMLVMRR